MMIRWNDDKDRILRAKRGVGFADVIDAIASGQMLADDPHPRQDLYPGQRLLIVAIGGHIHVVPYIHDADGLFLKTVYPSRSYTKRFEDALK